MKRKITLRALEQRINRKLAKENRRLCKARENTSDYNELGPYYTVNSYTNTVDGFRIHLDGLVEMAKELGAMGEWEEVADD